MSSDRASAAVAPPATVAFIGTGVMGAPMAAHLLRAGYRLRVHTRTRARAEELLAAGARWCADPAEAARGADVVLSMVGYPEDVAATHLGVTGRPGTLDALAPGALLVDLTTSSPALARTLAAAARARGIGALDAPVSGGDVGARAATLSIMCGGAPEDFARAEPLLRVMGKHVVLQGPAGAGQLTKLVNQIAIASTMVGVTEAMAFARRAGLDAARVLSSIEHGAAGSVTLSRLAPRMIAGDFAPGFYVKHFVKDLRLALEAAAELDLELPGLQQARSLYERLVAGGYGEEGTQALMRLYAP